MDLSTVPISEMSLPFLEGIHFLKFSRVKLTLAFNSSQEYQHSEFVKVNGLKLTAMKPWLKVSLKEVIFLKYCLRGMQTSCSSRNFELFDVKSDQKASQ